jgi:hypothetical protein
MDPLCGKIATKVNIRERADTNPHRQRNIKQQWAFQIAPTVQQTRSGPIHVDGACLSCASVLDAQVFLKSGKAVPQGNRP